MNINDYGNVPNTENMPGIPARVTAVHKERYEIVCQHGITHARLKTKEYFVDTQDFPTTGDFVMIKYIDNGDSQILATLPRRTFCKEYLDTFGNLYPRLPRQIIHRDPNPGSLSLTDKRSML